MSADLYSLTNALEATFNSQVPTIEALSDLGYLRLTLVEREAQLVLRAREEGFGWDRVAIALGRDPTVTAMMHGYVGVPDAER